MKKILIVSNYALGLYHFRKEFLCLLQDSGYEVHLTVPYGEEVAFFVERGMTYHPIEFHRRKANPLEELGLIWRYNQLIDQVKPDLVISYSIKPNIYVGLLSHIKRFIYMPMVTGIGTGMQSNSLMSRLLLPLLRIAFRKAAQVIFLNTSNQALYESKKIIHKQQALLIPGEGVNCEHFTYSQPTFEQPIQFLFLGRIMTEKGIGEIIEAAEMLAQKRIPCKINIYGINEEPEWIQRLEALSNPMVSYCGLTKQPLSVLEQHDCLVLPSYHEGMSMVVLEAMAAGRPVIGTDIPGIRESVVPHENGLLCAKQNSRDLAEQMEQFVTLPTDQKIKMSIQSRRRVEDQFNRSIINQMLLATVEKLLS